jgi:hypothetical protein
MSGRPPKLIKNDNSSHRVVTSASETIPEWTVPEGVTGDMLPASVVYVEGGKLIPALPHDPDLPDVLTAAANIKGWRKLKNGLAPRTDIMARLMARGVQGVAAYRTAFNRSDEPIQASTKAWRIIGKPRFAAALRAYREILERESRQRAVEVADYVKGRLVQESQTAKESAARIKALQLLGQTEGLFTTVHRTEKVMDAAQLHTMKAQLYQRLRQAMAVSGHTPQASLSHDTGSGSGTGIPQLEGTPPATPLNATGPIQEPEILSHGGDRVSFPRESQQQGVGGVFSEVPNEMGPGGDFPGTMHRLMTEDDL